jgi:predicted chitinase
MNHVHIGLPRGRHIKELLVNSDKIFTGSGKVITPSGDEDNSGGEGNENPSNIKATPEMITKLIQMLKSKNITSKDIKSLIDSSIGGSFDFSGPAVTGNVILKGNFDSVQKQNISLLLVEIGILSVVSKESNFRPKGEQSYANTSNSRIRKIFGSRVAKYSDAELDQLKKNPKDFFNVVYAKTVGNQGGDDGWVYRGRGFNQLTGIKNYEKYGRMAGMGDDLVKNPTLLDDPKISAKVALAFFTKGKSGSSFPNFNNKEDAAKYFADINSGGGVSSHRDSALAAAKKFDAKDNLA